MGRVYETNYLYIKTSGLWVYYSYIVGRKKYSGRSNLGLIYTEDFKNVLIGKEFPVTYCITEPEISSILIVPENFVNYGYDFTDTLNWVLTYRRNK